MSTPDHVTVVLTIEEALAATALMGQLQAYLNGRASALVQECPPGDARWSEAMDLAQLCGSIAQKISSRAPR